MSPVAQKLHDNGQRFTKQRENILDALTHQPHSVSEVSSSLLSKGVNVDKVTLYRSLNCFIDLGLVGKTQFKEREAKYELIDIKNHHHHLVCDNCGKIEDIPLNERLILNDIHKKTNFYVKSHTLEFYGVCAKCQSA